MMKLTVEELLACGVVDCPEFHWGDEREVELTVDNKGDLCCQVSTWQHEFGGVGHCCEHEVEVTLASAAAMKKLLCLTLTQLDRCQNKLATVERSAADLAADLQTLRDAFRILKGE